MYRKDKKNEYYTVRARKEGYAARSVYKLQEIDKKYRIFQKGHRVLDLGAAPGSWTQYLIQSVGKSGLVVAVDKEPLAFEPEPPVVFLQKDVFDLSAEDLKEFPGFNAVMSDLAPSTSGTRSLDAGRSFALTARALELARLVLLAGGSFIVKNLESELTGKIIAEAKQNFSFVKLFRPQAVRSESREIYIIATGFQSKRPSHD